MVESIPAPSAADLQPSPQKSDLVSGTKPEGEAKLDGA